MKETIQEKLLRCGFLTVKGSTTSALSYEEGTYTKMYACNEGRDVTIWLDGRSVTVPVEEFCEKMKAAFLSSTSPC